MKKKFSYVSDYVKTTTTLIDKYWQWQWYSDSVYELCFWMCIYLSVL